MHETDQSHLASQDRLVLAYVGGGSLNWAIKLMQDIAHDGRLPVHLRLYDLDHAAAQRNARLGARHAAQGAPLRVEACRDLALALQGADAVVVSILPGSFDDMGHDIDIPARYGITQSVGDTVGPGGFVRALRGIPMMTEIADAIAHHCPRAWVCNLTNPMSVLTGALYAAFPDIRAWGACHEVTKLRHILAWLANRNAGETRYTHDDALVNVLGINHFTFVDAARVGGRDMMPALLAFASEHREAGWRAEPRDPADEHARYFEDENRVKFDLTTRFGIAGAAGDRHLAEFLPQGWYLDRSGQMGFGLTPVDYRKRERAAKLAQAEALDNGAPLPAPARSDEALIDQLRAIAGGPLHLSNVNLPNRGQMDGLPAGAIVETNAIFSSLGVQPVQAGRLPAALELIVRGHADRQSALVEAVTARQWRDLFPLFLSDPLVAPLGPDRAFALFRDMLESTARQLPDGLLEKVA